MSNENWAVVPRWSVIGVWYRGEANATLMAANGKVIVFETPQDARDILPRLMGGRHFVRPDNDTICALELDRNGVNRAVVLWDYDIYNTPAGNPVPSEGRGRDWKHHLHWYYLFTDLGWTMDSAGRWYNSAIYPDYETQTAMQLGGVGAVK